MDLWILQLLLVLCDKGGVIFASKVFVVLLTKIADYSKRYLLNEKGEHGLKICWHQTALHLNVNKSPVW